MTAIFSLVNGVIAIKSQALWYIAYAHPRLKMNMK